VLPSTFMYFSVHYVYYMVYEMPRYILGTYLVPKIFVTLKRTEKII